jgi:hypothetical protein
MRSAQALPAAKTKTLATQARKKEEQRNIGANTFRD